MVEHETSVFMRFFRKYFVFGSKLAYLISCWKNEAPNWRRFSSVASKLMPLSGAGFLPWHQNWCHFDYLLTYSQWAKPFIKVFLKKTSKNSVAAQESGYCPSLSPWLKAILCPLKKIPSPNPWLEVVLSTYPAGNSPTIPYSNFCGWKTTRFLKKYSHNPIPQLSKPKNDTFSETFSKKLPALIPQVFSVESKPLFQKFFSTTVTGTFAVLSGTQIAKKA